MKTSREAPSLGVLAETLSLSEPQSPGCKMGLVMRRQVHEVIQPGFDMSLFTLVHPFNLKIF